MPTCSPERTRFAELLRAFYLGRITNDKLEDAVIPFCERDPVVGEVFCRGAFCDLYEFSECKFTDHDKLTPEGRQILARWILFLKSGKPYLWPKKSRIMPLWAVFTTLLSGIPLAFYTGRLEVTCLGFFILIIFTLIIDRREQRRFMQAHDYSVWPFITQDDFKASLLEPPYLTGLARDPSTSSG